MNLQSHSGRSVSMNRFDAAIDGTVKVLAASSMVAMLLMALHIVANVAQRFLFSRDLPGTLEFVTYYYMVFLTFIPLAYVAMKKAHIRVEFLDSMLGPRLARIVDFLCELGMAGFFFLLCWRTWVNALERTASREGVPSADGAFHIWPARWFVVAGLFVGGVYALISAVRLIRTRHAAPVPDRPLP